MKKILIVDDEIVYITLLRERLTPDYKVIDAKNGQEGLDKALKVRPDLILLDIMMPVMDGLTMLKELRQNAYGKTAKVVLLTNQEVTEEILRLAATYPSTYYFIKSDIGLDDLLKEIRKLLAKAS